jgi:hypothetical protein
MHRRSQESGDCETVGCIFSAYRPQLDKEVVAVSGVRVTLEKIGTMGSDGFQCVSRKRYSGRVACQVPEF